MEAALLPAAQAERPRLIWVWGTGYDLFASLEVMHDPEHYGLRKAWAAGVRARLPTPHRETLERANQALPSLPLKFLYQLPEPRDASTVLNVLEDIGPADRVRVLTDHGEMPPEFRERMEAVIAAGRWTEADRAVLAEIEEKEGKAGRRNGKRVSTTLEWWAAAEESGRRYLDALRAYFEAFFLEEERRIQPALLAALTRGRELAERLSLPELIERLSQGIRLESLEVENLVLSPSFWITPLIYFDRAPGEFGYIAYGARPADASLVPGEAVPDTLLRMLQVLGDPTRLRILRYLTRETLTPAQLSRRLRLRVPTVLHHLQIMRLASMVHVTVGPAKDKYYSVRREMLDSLPDQLQSFLGEGRDTVAR